MQYKINKGINRAIEFKGVKAQYLIYLAAGLVGLLILFAVGYIAGVKQYVLFPVVIGLGTALFQYVSRFSHLYGAHGLMKRQAFRKITPAITCCSRKTFLHLRKK